MGAIVSNQFQMKYWTSLYIRIESGPSNKRKLKSGGNIHFKDCLIKPETFLRHPVYTSRYKFKNDQFF